MDTAMMLLDQARQSGLNLSVVDGKLALKGKQTPATETVLQAITANKQAVLDCLLAAQAPDDELFVGEYSLPPAPPPRPPLPEYLYQTGIAMFDEAWRLKMRLDRSYRVALGKDSEGYYLLAPIW